MSAVKPRNTSGRYRIDRFGNVGPAPGKVLASGLGRPPASVHVRTAVASVPDPWSPGGQLLATVNRRVDVLEDERSHGRISEGAYREGRFAQAVFERVRGPGSSNWQGGSRVDAYVSKELAIIHGLEDATRIRNMVDWMRQGEVLGRIDANIVQRVLGENKSFAEVATLQGKSGERGTRYIAARFRDALEALAGAKAAHGRERSRP